MGNNMTYRFGNIEDTYRANTVIEFFAKADGITDDTAAINNALASGASQVFFPPGTYKIDGYVTSAVANQTIIFDNGAELQITPNTGKLQLTGTKMHVIGLKAKNVSSSSSVFSSIVLGGESMTVDGINFTSNADIENATLIQLAENDMIVNNIMITSDFRFLKGVSINKINDTSPLRVTIDGLRTSILPSTTKALGTLLDIHGGFSVIKNLSITTGGNSTFSQGVVYVRASNQTFYDPQIFCFNAQYGIYGEDSASEKLTIFQGNIQCRNNGTYVSGSEGIRVGHQSGHQKLYGTFINGWENGVVFHGSADSPGFFGAIIANNQNYAFVIDATTPASSAVRGLNIIDCYLSDVTQKYFMHCIGGKLEGCNISGNEIGYDDIGILVDPGFLGLNGMVLQSNFIQGGGHGATPLGIIQPNSATERTLFINNKTQNTGTDGYGAFASRAINIFTPTFDSVVATNSLIVGSTGTPWIKRFSTFFTANFGAGVPADGYTELDFSWSDGAVGTHMVTHGISSALGNQTALIYTSYVPFTGTVRLRADNHTASPIGAFSGTVFFESTKNF
jgi:hypothetical protein